MYCDVYKASYAEGYSTQTKTANHQRTASAICERKLAPTEEI